MSDMSEFLDDVFAQYSDTVTDTVFLLIQNDRELMHRYLRLVSDMTLDTVNQQIGRAVKTRLNLTNAPRRNSDPVSTLIKSHQEFV